MDYRAAVQAGYDGMTKGDPGPLFSLFDEKTEWIEAAGYPYGGAYTGANAVADGVFAKLMTEWDGYIVGVDRLIADGTTVAAIGTYSGTYKATGKSMKARFVHLYDFEGDKLRRWEQFVDSAKVNEAL